MARRRPRQDDSLELLLDTICNTFGGVLFIAILVVVLLQTTGAKSLRDELEIVAPEYLQEKTLRLSELRAELSSLQGARSEQQNLLVQFAPAETRQLIAHRNDLHARADRLDAERADLLIENAKRRERVDSILAEVASSREQLQRLNRRADDLRAELRQRRESRIQDIRMPVVRSSIKNEVGLILRYGRMYVWHRYDRFGNRLGLNSDEFVVVADHGDELVTQPNPAAGTPLNQQDETKRQIRDRLRQFDPSDVYMVVVVRQDTFPHFRILRDILIEMGFEYRLMPMQDGTAVRDRGGSGGRVQ